MRRDCISTTIFFLFILLLTPVSSQLTANFDQQLRQELFSNRKLDPLKRPRTLQNETTTLVSLGASFYSINKLDVRENTLKINLWLRIEWVNPDVSWDPKVYGGIKTIHVNPNLMWTPRITLINSLVSADNLIFTLTHAVVRYNGGVTVIAPMTAVTFCAADIHNFPFDQHTCSLVFGSWTHDGTHANVSIGSKPEIDLVSSESNEFDLISVEAKRVTHRHACCKEIYSAALFTLELSRKSSIYQVGIFLPASLVCLMTAGIFWVNPPTRHRLTLSVFLLLSNLLFLIHSSFILPSSAEGTPHIIIFSAHALVFSALAVVLSVVSLSLSCQRPSISPPNFVHELTHGWVSKLMPSTVEAVESKFGNTGWLLLAAFVDRICFVIYCISFLIIFILYLR